jgi:sugar phosphate isomerase/epimerase
MKYAFTTLGCPEWDLATIIARAKEYGYDGIDFRGYMNVTDITTFPEFSTDAKNTAKKIADAGLEVTCFSSGVCVNETPEKQQLNFEEIQRYAALCEIFGAKYIRIFGGGALYPRSTAIADTARKLKPLIAEAKKHGVILLLETHDSWTESNRIKELLELVDSPSLALVWDIHHPIRVNGEDIKYTWKMLGKWVLNTHWKDAIDQKLYAIGDGNLPLKEWYQLLQKNHYSGYCTLESEKKWHPELDEPEVAFPAFINYLQKIQNEIR